MTDDCTPKQPHDPHADVDARLRSAFEAGPGASARVASAALAAASSSAVRRERGLRWVGMAAAAAVVVLAAALALRPSRPVTSPEPVPGGAPPLTGSFTDGVLVVSLPDGSVSILGGGVREDRPPDGYGFVLVEGELR